MSTRSNLRPMPVIVNGNMSGNITSQPTVLQSLTIGSYSYSWAGAAPVGAVSIQVSDDYSLNANGTVNNPGTWAPIYFTLNGAAVVNSAPIAGSPGNGILEFSSSSYAVRTVYTFTSGTGSLQVIFNGKVT